MSEVEIIDKLKKIFKLVVNKDANVENISADSKIISDLGVNSVGIIYLAIAIEETFDVDVTSVSYNTFVTVGDVVNYIRENA